MVVVPSITLDRAVAGQRQLTQAIEERFLFLLLLLRQPRLRMIYVTSMPIAPEIVEYYLALLPGVIPSHAQARLVAGRRSTTPRPGRSARSCWSGPRVLARIARADPEPAAGRIWSPTTPPSSSATSRSASASRCTAPTRGWPTSGPRPAAGGSSPSVGRAAPARRRGPAQPRRHRRRDRARCAPSARRCASAIVKLNEGVSGAGNALVDLARPPAAGGAGRAGRGAGPARGRWSWSHPTTPFDVYVAKFAEGGGIVEERIDGRRAAQPQRAAAGACRAARSSCSPPTTSCWAERAARATWAASSPPTPLRAADHRARRDDRAPGWPSWAPSGGSPSTSSWSATARRLDAVRDRAQPPQGRHHPPVPDPAVPDRRPLRRRRRRCSSRRDGDEKHLVATDHLESDLLRGLVPRRPLRHRRPARAALRPVPAGRASSST